MDTRKIRRRGAPCRIPYAAGVVVDGQVVEVPRGHGFEIPDGEGVAPAPGWEFVEDETEEPAAAGGEER